MNCTLPPWLVCSRLGRPIAAALGFLLVAWTGFAAEATKSFNIPAGPAETTLRQFAQQAGGQFVYSAEKVAGVRTNELKGEFSAREGLQRLVAGTALRAVQDERTGALTVDRVATPPSSGGGGTGAIEGRVLSEATGNYVNNARVVIEGQRLETFTDEQGRYSFPRVPAG